MNIQWTNLSVQFILKVKLSVALTQYDVLKRRGCLVVVGKKGFPPWGRSESESEWHIFLFFFQGRNLFHMGGVTELIDPLNMGEQVRYVQLGKEMEGS